VDIAKNGTLAMELHSSKAYDLVFMDIHMPEMNGYEVARRIRAGGSTTPIIAITAGNLQEDRQRSLDSGMNGFLHKPVTRKDLVRMIETYGKRKQEHDQTFSYRELADRACGDKDLMERLLITFLKDTPLQLTAIEEAIEIREWSTVCRLIHRLRGAAGNMSAKNMWNLLQDTQLFCSKDHEPSTGEDYIIMKKLIKELNNEFDLFYKAAKEEIDICE
jgi:CheY-like chemotaxis protein/HPt (histidine-containing phosphotransfer) domain-containing protein